MNIPAKRLLGGLAVTFLIAGCASSATVSSPSQVSTPTRTVTAASPSPASTPNRIVTAAPASNPTGQMTVGRGNHRATLLADGGVLVTGGFGTGLVPLATAELYDPKSGTFSPTGSMATVRAGHTATLLTDGRVLVAGGKAPPTGLATAELFDPKSGTFSPTGSMATAREVHTATRLADGRVLVIGGQGEPGGQADPTGLATAELYDPRSGTFSPTGQLAGGRVDHTATLLTDGRVLVTGGFQTILVGAGVPLATTELYDPTSGRFSPTGSMATARVGNIATLLPDGRVLVAGGTDAPNLESLSAEMLASAELYDPATGNFSPTGSMTTARAAQTGTPLADGLVLVAGGIEAIAASGPGPFLASADLYDPRTGTFSAPRP